MNDDNKIQRLLSIPYNGKRALKASFKYNKIW